ncbi:hypothetical protein AC579_7987 [Pseudocercospora musae]|uniref:Uncharacterized protein n=1 Tax=Pseudocercospora musae TaxID=113226 RepID=A0A139I0E6_9PEZI|nr:hypothetical protein AC579_7987 [Pseudocercospora musae]
MCHIRFVQYECGCLHQHVLSVCLGNKQQANGSRAFCRIRRGRDMRPSMDDGAITHRIPAECPVCRKAREKNVLVADVIDKINDTRLDRNLVVQEHEQKLEDLDQLCRHNILNMRKPKLPRRQDIPSASPLVPALNRRQFEDCVVDEVPVRSNHRLPTERISIGYEPRQKLTDSKGSSEVYGLVSIGEACFKLNESYRMQRKASTAWETLQLARQNLRELLVRKAMSRQRCGGARKSGSGALDKSTQPGGQGLHQGVLSCH